MNGTSTPIEPVADDYASTIGEFEPLEYVVAAERSMHQSLGSAIYRHSFENGRRYHYYRNGKYPIPNDNLEQTRDDMKHALIMELTNGTLYHAPIGDKTERIIDVGTGTGIWAIEMGDRFPDAVVLGVDLSPIQPIWIPPNVKFIIDDVEDEWLPGDGAYDFVHIRHVAPFISKFDAVLEHSYENLKPGGYVEVSDFDGIMDCDDGTLPNDWPIKIFLEKLNIAMNNIGREFQVAPKVGKHLEAAGFVNLTRKVYKVPIGSWPKDKTLRLVGMYMRQVIDDFLDAAVKKPFQTLNMSEEEVSNLIDSVSRMLPNRSAHGYARYYVWVAQKPVGTAN